MTRFSSENGVLMIQTKDESFTVRKKWSHLIMETFLIDIPRTL